MIVPSPGGKVVAVKSIRARQAEDAYGVLFKLTKTKVPGREF